MSGVWTTRTRIRLGKKKKGALLSTRSRIQMIQFHGKTDWKWQVFFWEGLWFSYLMVRPCPPYPIVGGLVAPGTVISLYCQSFTRQLTIGSKPIPMGNHRFWKSQLAITCHWFLPVLLESAAGSLWFDPACPAVGSYALQGHPTNLPTNQLWLLER